MPTTQATLGDNTSTSTTGQHQPATTGQTTLAPPDQRGGNGCCPWCLAAPETFVHHDDGTVGCGHCDAAIPIGVEWYERGEKIPIESENR